MASIVSNSLLLSKFRGCMIGGLIGDCMGDRFEFKSDVTHAMVSTFFTDLLSGASKEDLRYTDDTSMSVSLAKSLVEKKEVHAKDLAQKFVSEFFRDPRRYGCHIRLVFFELKETKFADVFLPATKQFNGSGSYGNGSAMRIAPLALFGIKKTEDFLIEAVTETSLITHTHAFGYNGAILQCFAVRAALKLDPTQELDPIQFICGLEDKMNAIQPKDDVAPYLESLEKIKVIFLQRREDTVSAREIAELLGNNVLAQTSISSAIYSFLRGLKPLSDFESDNPYVRTIFFAISIGGDTDTIACMAGNIAGAYYGMEKIPNKLKKRCEKNMEVDKLAQKLYKVSGHKIWKMF